jgi:hypothetical protein
LRVTAVGPVALPAVLPVAVPFALLVTLSGAAVTH